MPSPHSETIVTGCSPESGGPLVAHVIEVADVAVGSHGVLPIETRHLS